MLSPSAVHISTRKAKRVRVTDIAPSPLIRCPSATSLTSVRPFVVGVDLAELGKNPGDRRGLQVLRDVVLIPRASEKFVEARVQPHHVTRTPTLPLRVMRDSPLT